MLANRRAFRTWRDGHSRDRAEVPRHAQTMAATNRAVPSSGGAT